MKVTGIDHIVLRVADAEASITWYSQVLGLVPERVEEWRAGQVFFPSLRIDDHTIIDLLVAPRTGENVDHVALTVTGVDLEALAASGEVDVHSGPAELWGAQGTGIGLYIHDPDGNLVELRVYP